MVAKRIQRRLAAILAVDVVGYRVTGTEVIDARHARLAPDDGRRACRRKEAGRALGQSVLENQEAVTLYPCRPRAVRAANVRSGSGTDLRRHHQEGLLLGVKRT